MVVRANSVAKKILVVMANSKPNYISKLRRITPATTKAIFLAIHKLNNIELIKPYKTKSKRSKEYIITKKGLEIANILIKVDEIIK